MSVQNDSPKKMQKTPKCNWSDNQVYLQDVENASSPNQPLLGQERSDDDAPSSSPRKKSAQIVER